MLYRALQMAWEAHNGQFRKETNIPYIVHPVEVAVILIENGASEEVIAAGLLHDTLEDTKLTIKDISTSFGDKICRLVIGVSEPEKLEVKIELTEECKRNTWKGRKEHTVTYLKNFASDEEKLIACADKLSNIRSMAKEYKIIGDKLWEKFNNKDKEEHKWYFESLISSLSSIEKYPMYKELCQLFAELFTLNS